MREPDLVLPDAELPRRDFWQRELKANDGFSPKLPDEKHSFWLSFLAGQPECNPRRFGV